MHGSQSTEFDLFSLKHFVLKGMTNSSLQSVQWTGLVNWTSGLDWWQTGLKIRHLCFLVRTYL